MVARGRLGRAGARPAGGIARPAPGRTAPRRSRTRSGFKCLCRHDVTIAITGCPLGHLIIQVGFRRRPKYGSPQLPRSQYAPNRVRASYLHRVTGKLVKTSAHVITALRYCQPNLTYEFTGTQKFGGRRGTVPAGKLSCSIWRSTAFRSPLSAT